MGKRKYTEKNHYFRSDLFLEFYYKLILSLAVMQTLEMTLVFKLTPTAVLGGGCILGCTVVVAAALLHRWVAGGFLLRGSRFCGQFIALDHVEGCVFVGCGDFSVNSGVVEEWWVVRARIRSE